MLAARRVFLVALPGVGVGLSGGARLLADELTVLSSNATRPLVEALAPPFEREQHLKLAFRFAPSAELKARIESGEPFDCAFLASDLVDELILSGDVDSSTRAAVARAGAGVAIRKGARKPDVTTTEALKRALLEAESIAYVGQGVTADIMRGVFERFGIGEAMRAKTKVLGGVGAAEAVASGQAELGFTQISEILPHSGVDLAGPLPPEVQVYTRFEAVVGSSARRPEAARRFIERALSKDAFAILRSTGMEPLRDERRE